eukprot:scaffold586163_cov45-Prasinocladus_malaysianus.AAC.1
MPLIHSTRQTTACLPGGNLLTGWMALCWPIGDPGDGVTVAKECEVSNAVHRALTVHGMRDPLLHHEVM